MRRRALWREAGPHPFYMKFEGPFAAVEEFAWSLMECQRAPLYMQRFEDGTAQVVVTFHHRELSNVRLLGSRAGLHAHESSIDPSRFLTLLTPERLTLAHLPRTTTPRVPKRKAERTQGWYVAFDGAGAVRAALRGLGVPFTDYPTADAYLLYFQGWDALSRALSHSGVYVRPAHGLPYVHTDSLPTKPPVQVVSQSQASGSNSTHVSGPEQAFAREWQRFLWQATRWSDEDTAAHAQFQDRFARALADAHVEVFGPEPSEQERQATLGFYQYTLDEALNQFPTAHFEDFFDAPGEQRGTIEAFIFDTRRRVITESR